MKISELIPMLSALMREVGDAEVCVQTGTENPQQIGPVFTGRNVSIGAPEEQMDIVVLKAKLPNRPRARENGINCAETITPKIDAGRPKRELHPSTAEVEWSWGKTNAMTDRVHTLTVTLDREYREDDVQHIIDAIKMTKGVMDVQEHITNPNVYYAQETAKNELRSKIMEVLKPGWAKR